jgi:hypothetical protein
MASGKVKIKGGPDLLGWDAIADAMGVARSTAQLWEAHGMPVLRWGKTVAAYSDELLAWHKSRGKRRAKAA